MMTLLQMRTQVLGKEGHRDTELTGTSDAVDAAINEALVELYAAQPWYWNTTSATVTAASNILLAPSGAVFILAVLNPEDKIVQPRREQRRNDYLSRLEKGSTEVYFLDGLDGSIGQVRLSLIPDGTGDYTVRYCAGPTALSADADEPLGPDLVGNFLVWRARWIRLQGDEERPSLTDRALARSQNLLGQLAHLNAAYFSDIDTSIAVPRA